jgi:hypothetical protein
MFDLRQLASHLYPMGYLTSASLGFVFGTTITAITMPMLFWLPIIFMSTVFEIVASPSIPAQSEDNGSRNLHDSSAKVLDGTEENRPEDAANLTAQVADLKQVIISLRAQLADMNGQLDRWQSRTDRISLTASY